MKKLILITLLFLNLLSFSQTDLVKKESRTFTEKQLREDLNLLRKALEEAHPALYNFTNKTTFDSLFKTIDASLKNGMNESQFFTLISEIFGKVKCGHTRAYPSDELRAQLFTRSLVFPYRIKIVNKQLYIVSSYYGDTTIKTGTRILSINDTEVSQIISKFYGLFFSDGNNLTTRYKVMEGAFIYYLNIVYDEKENYDLKLSAPNTTTTFTISKPAILVTDRKKPKPGKLINFELTGKDQTTGVLTIKSWETPQLEHAGINFNGFIDSVFAIIKNKRIQNLIIDLRDNAGGDPALVNYLYSYLAEREYGLLNKPVFKTDKPLTYFGDGDSSSNYFLYYKYNFEPKNGNYVWKDANDPWYGIYQPKKDNYRGKVSVLMNGGSFSSSGFFGSLIRYYKRGKIIGVESGGSCYCNDCHAILILPNTKIRTEIPRATITMNLPGYKYDGHGIIPDQLIDEKPEDMISGNDRALNFALEFK